jgi:UDP-N-acetyl-D-mannosaminouronate:lipid I N-acetyl-D-mannosaminouronosyltransferase
MIYNPITVVNNINIFPFVSIDELIEYILDKKKIVIAINAEKIFLATEQTRIIINNNIGYADGIGAVAALMQIGCKNIVKIRGCELWLKIIERYCSNKSFYLIGGKQNIVEQAVEKLQKQFPQIDIVNYRNGYIDEGEEIVLLNDMQKMKPDIVFVAMGSPKQEIFMDKMLSIYPALYMGLGGSFDGYVNNSVVPSFMQNNYEWFYRFLKEPSRISKRLIRLLWSILRFLFTHVTKYDRKHNNLGKVKSTTPHMNR